MAAPYATELLQLQDAAAQQGFLINQLQQQASELGAAAAAMPTRIARMDRWGSASPRHRREGAAGGCPSCWGVIKQATRCLRIVNVVISVWMACVCSSSSSSSSSSTPAWAASQPSAPLMARSGA